MPSPSPGRRLQAALWELSPPVRRTLRRLRRSLSLIRHRLRRLTDDGADPRVIPMAAATETVLPDPAITVVDGGDPTPLADQTERSIAVASDADRAGRAGYLGHGDLGTLPTVHLEALLMAAAAEPAGWVVGGWAPPAPGPFGPSGAVFRDPAAALAAHALVRLPSPGLNRRGALVGRVIPHITSAERCAGLDSLDQPASIAVGPHRLAPAAAGAAVIRQSWSAVDRALAALPDLDGRPTVLFLLPFLAVGGAERLLFDLLDGLSDRARLLVATTDPHLEALGQTVDRARELTPQVYTLGDWLPRDAVASAMRHLIRRWRVETLVCWNGSVTFYDEVAALRRLFPRLRIVNQLYNHSGGWIEHLTRSLIRAVDVQIAVNGQIAHALTTRHGVPLERVETIRHAVGRPGPRDDHRRARLRSELGVDVDTVVVGTFIRMHAQKRPLDVVRLARAMTDDPVHFLLVGGGPLDAEVDREIARDPPPNLTRRPMVADAAPLYDALDLCLLTSAFEGLPVFLLDGLARGLPCVATAVGDVPLLLSGGGGGMVERPGDIEGLASAIRSLLGSDNRRAEGERGRRTVEERFGLERYVDSYERVIFPSGR